MGTIVIGGGGALATGAFSTVEATREVSIETGSDTDALLGLSIESEILRGEDEDVIEFDLDKDLNLEATTTFDDAFEITNNSENNIIVTITGDDDDENDLLTDDVEEEDNGMYFESDDVDDGELPISEEPDETKTLSVVFKQGENEELPGSITIVAEKDD